jgi:hypothetical protein
MTHPKYTQQALSRYNLPRLKKIAAELGVTATGDKRASDTWVNAIITHQFNQLQKVDNQALAQAELDNYIADQAQAVAPEPLTIVEISFDHHEYYADDKLVASISHDDNHLTQRWVVMINDKEIFRANTLMRCDIASSALTTKTAHYLCRRKKQHPPRPKTKSWRISSTSAKIMGLKFSMMGFTTTTA